MTSKAIYASEVIVFLSSVTLYLIWQYAFVFCKSAIA